MDNYSAEQHMIAQQVKANGAAVVQLTMRMLMQMRPRVWHIDLNGGVDAFMDDALDVFGEMGTRYASFFSFQYLVPDSV